MKTLAIAALAALAVRANAECANACSGNGECSTKDQCICYDGFYGSDCSLKRCPSALAFVDVPNGDLNHDGSLGRGVQTTSAYSKVQWSRYLQAEYWPTVKGTLTTDAKGVVPPTNGGAFEAVSGEAHWYTECSGKGACDRATGECQCFDGYTGAACQRTTCPNDCSGHGVCRQVKDIAAGAMNKKFVDSANGVNSYSGVSSAFEYRLWDADKNSACVCDLGYGGVDCSLRECPRGDDPLTTLNAVTGQASMDEIQGFSLSANSKGKYYINFVDFEGNVWKTATFAVDHTSSNAKALDNNAAVKAALEGLPNSLVGGVTVSSSASYGPVRYLVTFTSIPGNVPEFTVVRADADSLDPVVQPNEPVQYLTFTTAPANTNVLTMYFDPVNRENVREAQVKASLATATVGDNADFNTAVITASGLKYDLGSTPVSLLPHTDNLKKQFAVVFKNNVNKPGAARNWGLNKVRVTWGAETATVSQDAYDGNKEYSVCSNRGICDYSSGLCACFPGYVGSACEGQSALAQ
jgi:hypothetical protein